MNFMDTQPAPLDGESGLDPYAEFRVESTRDIAALMRELSDGATPIRLSGPSGAGLTTVIWSVDASAGRLSLRADGDDPQLQALIGDDEVTAVTYLEAVKLQFDLHGLVLVRGAQSSALKARMPQHVYRFQRRQAYRVRTLERTSPVALLRHPALPDKPIRLRVIDVSIGGCALMLDDGAPPLKAGSIVPGVRIELDADTRFEATLSLQHVTSIQPTGQGARLGCAFRELDGQAQRALQRYIDQTQKRRRLLSLS